LTKKKKGRISDIECTPKKIQTESQDARKKQLCGQEIVKKPHEESFKKRKGKGPTGRRLNQDEREKKEKQQIQNER